MTIANAEPVCNDAIVQNNDSHCAVSIALTPDLIVMIERYQAKRYLHVRAARLQSIAKSEFLKQELEHDHSNAWLECQDAAEQLANALVDVLQHAEVTL